MLTGGLDTARISAYLSAGVAMVGVGKAILDPGALAAKQYTLIGTHAQEILRVIRETKR
jgi:2-keto-3-deoxy-6-phosphogluconate aldolase